MSEMVSRRSRFSQFGRILSCQLSDVDHGPSHVLRPAIVPIWLLRQSRIEAWPVESNVRIPAATLAAVAGFEGSNTNARSFRPDPSPLTSPLTIGVYGAPEESCAVDVSSISCENGKIRVPTNECVRWRSLVVHGSEFGLPAVGAEMNPPAAEPPENDD